MKEITIAPPDPAPIREGYALIVREAYNLTVTNREQHEEAQEILKRIAGAQRRVNERLDPIVSSAHKAHRGLTSLRGELLEPLAAARCILNEKCARYEEEQRAIAERERVEREALARKEEEDRILEEAAAAEAAGDTDLAEEILNETPTTVAMVAEPEVAKVQGVSTTSRWRAEVTDLVALIKHCAANPVQANLVQPNMQALSYMARSLRTELRIPGVRAFESKSKTVRLE